MNIIPGVLTECRDAYVFGCYSAFPPDEANEAVGLPRGGSAAVGRGSLRTTGDGKGAGSAVNGRLTRSSVVVIERTVFTRRVLQVPVTVGDEVERLVTSIRERTGSRNEVETRNTKIEELRGWTGQGQRSGMKPERRGMN